jgi:hypothetical protein
MKIRLLFEHRQTAQRVKVTIDTAAYATREWRGDPTGAMARVAACDAIATAQHMLGADRPAQLYLIIATQGRD